VRRDFDPAALPGNLLANRKLVHGIMAENAAGARACKVSSKTRWFGGWLEQGVARGLQRCNSGMACGNLRRNRVNGRQLAVNGNGNTAATATTAGAWKTPFHIAVTVPESAAARPL
jgi:hypothetical protein